MFVYLPKKQHQTLNEALEIVVLSNRGISIQRDVTEYLRPTERKMAKGRATALANVSLSTLIFNFNIFLKCIFDQIRYEIYHDFTRRKS